MHILGIRHHGPGSAESTLKALRYLRPELLLVEIPADLQGALGAIGQAELEPPVALLAYDPRDFSTSTFLPFAEFSPEWQAIHWAHGHAVPVVAMDLPLGIQLAKGEGTEKALPLPHSLDEKERQLRRDPLGYLASLAGYSDRERWWEDTFEREAGRRDTFEAVRLLMGRLREEAAADPPEILLREAHMRKSIRKAAKQGHRNVVVLCGAWHVPALEDWDRVPAAQDNAKLRKRARRKLQTTWIPWSYSRLAVESGYRSGVRSPAWYEMLFEDRAGSSLRWLIEAARLLRSEDLDASAAHVQEAVLLANALARLRNRRTPGLQELEEAAHSVFTQGQTEPLELIRRQLIVGDRIGRVAPSLAKVPLLEDLHRQIRSARLKKEHETTLPLEKTLDLRKPANLKASLLLHRLRLLDIPWGQLRAGSDQQTGSFSEHWKLQWHPDFAIQLIQAAIWGNTVEEAATALAIQRGRNAESLRSLGQVTQDILQADLKQALGQVLPLLEERAAQTNDIAALLESLPLLVRIWRYGNTRRTDTTLVDHLLQALLPRIFVGLPGLALGLEDEEAGRRAQHLIAAHHAVYLLERPEFGKAWLQAVERLSDQDRNHPLLRGIADRMVFDKGVRGLERTRMRMQRQLSRFEGAPQWLEGFLYGSGQLLIHQPGLWSILDEWLAGLPEEFFAKRLPILRRTFAHFSKTERKRMLGMASPGTAVVESPGTDLDPERLALLKPLLQDILWGS